MVLESSELRLILASASPRRKSLLEQLGLEFEVIPSRADESVPAGLSPSGTVEHIARQKGEEVASRITGALLIAADTLVALGPEILGKPKNETEAAGMLRQLSGKSHDVYTGVSLILVDNSGYAKKQATFSERTKVTFATLTENEIRMYVQSGKPLDKAGSYGIQDDFGSVFVSRIEGDFYNVVGLPVHAVYRQIKEIVPQILYNGKAG